MAAQQPTRPTGILQADQYPVAQNGNGAHAPETPAGMCGRCHGSGTTARGVCPVCAGRRVAR
jgi:DnaJ-class molecular chaperone